LEVGDLSTEQEFKKLEQDALFTRFVELFKDFFYKSPVTLQCLDLDLPELHQLFHYSWDKKVLPSKQVLMKAVHIRPSPMSFAGKSEDNVAEDFAAALEALEIEEHNKSEGAETTKCEETNGNVFRREGDYWIVTYGEKGDLKIKTSVGMEYIGYLLAHAGERFRTPLDLEAAVRGQTIGTHAHHSEMTEKQLEKEGLSIQRSVYEKYDHTTKSLLKTCHEQLQEVDREIDRAEKDSNVTEVQRQREIRQGVLDQVRELSKRPKRGWDEENDKARKRIWNAIDRAIEHIKIHKQLQSLATHLIDNLKPLRFPYSYNPQPPIHWVT